MVPAISTNAQLLTLTAVMVRDDNGKILVPILAEGKRGLVDKVSGLILDINGNNCNNAGLFLKNFQKHVSTFRFASPSRFYSS